MKALDTSLFAATLVLVPALAWFVGRAMGRRDRSIASVLWVAVLVAILPHLARLTLLAATDQHPFDEALRTQFERTWQNPEVGLFFLAFAVFMTMLGWTSTPVSVHKS